MSVKVSISQGGFLYCHGILPAVLSLHMKDFLQSLLALQTSPKSESQCGCFSFQLLCYLQEHHRLNEAIIKIFFALVYLFLKRQLCINLSKPMSFQQDLQRCNWGQPGLQQFVLCRWQHMTTHITNTGPEHLCLLPCILSLTEWNTCYCFSTIALF